MEEKETKRSSGWIEKRVCFGRRFEINWFYWMFCERRLPVATETEMFPVFGLQWCVCVCVCTAVPVCEWMPCFKRWPSRRIRTENGMWQSGSGEGMDARHTTADHRAARWLIGPSLAGWSCVGNNISVEAFIARYYTVCGQCVRWSARPPLLCVPATRAHHRCVRVLRAVLTKANRVRWCIHSLDVECLVAATNSASWKIEYKRRCYFTSNNTPPCYLIVE